jgi:hypothetical protein
MAWVARRSDREDARVVAQRGRTLVAREDVADDRNVQGTECRGAHPLHQAQRQEQFEAAGEGAKAAGDPEEEQGGDQDLAPSVVVGEDAEDGGQRDAGQGEDRDQESHLPARDAERVPYLRQRRRDARDAQDRHKRDPEEDVQVVVLVDLPGSGFVLRHRSHEGRMYQPGAGRADKLHTPRR